MRRGDQMDPQHGPPQTDLLIGQTIGNYLVIQKLGEGGMGSVYLAEHPQIGKKVALKVLHAEFSANQEVTKRFFNEARAVNDIGHPNIVDVIDYGVIQAGAGRDQLVYFIMEYLQGGTLSQLIRTQSPLPPERAFGIAMQVADALAASHKQGIVHRDLKPDNIMLQQRGREADFVKLVDFGIAKLTNDAKGSSQTRTGIVMGTPAYMSPEQCEGRGNIDHRTDVYALGIVLYEMLTGRVPFIGEGYGEIIVQHLAQRPTPPSAFRMLPPHVEVVVMKALEKRPDMRFPTMEEMMRAMADPVGYVEAHGGVQSFLQVQLMPSTAPVPMRTPGPFTPVPGTLQQPSGGYGTPGSGIYAPGASPTPTTLGAAAGQVAPRKGKTGFLIAGLLVVGAAGAGIAVVLSGKNVESGGGTTQAADAAVEQPPVTPGSADKTVDRGSAAAQTGSATAQTGSAGSAGSAAAQTGSATAQTGSAGSAVVPEEPKVSVITLTTTPPGAAIYIDGIDTGKVTPQPIEVPRDKKAVTITLRLDRYQDKVLKNLSVDSDVNDTFELKKKSSGTGKGTTGTGKGSGKGTGSSRKDDTGLERPE
ncbi:MAG: protein kinase [Myxococcales bacterium]|nr:protein kinase [Myxococcales bacterium]